MRTKASFRHECGPWAPWLALIVVAGAGSAGARHWVEGPPAPTDGLWARARVQMVFDSARSRVVLYGGEANGGHRFADDTWEWDGATWTRGPAAPAAMPGRGDHGMAFDRQRSVTVVFGGVGASGEMNDTWEYDGVAWMPGPVAPAGLSRRRPYAMAYDTIRRRCVIFGGHGVTYDFQDTWEYDGVSWLPGPAAPAGMGAHVSHALAFDEARGVVVLHGGSPGGNATWEYDGSAWVPGIPMPVTEGRFGHRMAFDSLRGKVLLAGGNACLSELWEYDGATWAQLPDVPGEGRFRHGMTYDAARGQVVVFGGYCSTGDDLLLFDEVAWSSGPKGPPALVGRVDAAMAYDSARRRVVMHGGESGDVWYLRFDSTWEYDGTAWSPGAPAPPALSARANHAMAYDERRARVVMLGGRSSYLLSDTWELDGQGWVPGAPFGGEAREGHTMAYDAVRARTVMFGGRTVSGASFETWEHDGTGWVARGVQGPPARYEHAMAFDGGRGVVVLHGGNGGQGRNLDDTWEYDGGWTRGPDPPPLLKPRSGHGMAYDAVIGRTVMFGDGGGTGILTWEWDGSEWTPGGLPSGYTPRRGHGMAYDAGRERVVTFGGEISYAGGTVEYDDTWEYVDDAFGYVAGAGAGPQNANRVRVLNSGGGTTGVDFLAYAAGGWGVHVGAGDVDGSARDALLTAPGPGPVYGPNVRGWRRDGTPIAKIAFFAYGTLRYGAHLTSDLVDADGYDEIVTGAGPGQVFGPHVRGWDFDAVQLAPMPGASFFAYATLKFGASIGAGDLAADGTADLLTGPGPGAVFAPLVRGFRYAGASIQPLSKVSFWGFAELEYGVRLSGGDVDADGHADIAVGRGSGPTMDAAIKGFSVASGAVVPLPGFDVLPFPTSYGARPAIGLVAPGSARLLAAAGEDPAADATVLPYVYASGHLGMSSAFVAIPQTPYGVSVVAGLVGN